MVDKSISRERGKGDGWVVQGWKDEYNIFVSEVDGLIEGFREVDTEMVNLHNPPRSDQPYVTAMPSMLLSSPCRVLTG